MSAKGPWRLLRVRSCIMCDFKFFVHGFVPALFSRFMAMFGTLTGGSGHISMIIKRGDLCVRLFRY